MADERDERPGEPDEFNVVTDDDRPVVVFACNRQWSSSLIELLQTRFRVVLADNTPEVVACIADLRPRLLMLGPDLPHAQALELCRRVRLDPQLRSLSITMVDDGRGSADEAAGLVAGVNRAVRWPGAEEELFRVLHDLTRVAARRDARLMVRIDVELMQAVRFAVGFSHNLSTTGMLLEGEFSPGVGSRLGLCFAVPNHRREVRLGAEVVRIHAYAVTRTQFGVRYVDIADQEREVIGRFVDNGLRLGVSRP